MRVLIVLSMFWWAGCTQQEGIDSKVLKAYEAGYNSIKPTPPDTLRFGVTKFDPTKQPCCTVVVTDTVYINLSFPVPIWTVDQHGRPIENVMIDISELGSKRRMMVVTDRGGYARPLLPEGQWRIWAANPHLFFNDTTIEVKRAVNPVVLVSQAVFGP